MKNEIKRLNRSAKLVWAVVLAAVAIASAAPVVQAGPSERTYIVEGLSNDLENEVDIVLYMEPRSKFDAIFAMDPLSATDPARIILAASETQTDPNLANKTFFLGEILGVPRGLDREFSLDVTPRIAELDVTFQLIPDVQYIVLAVYTDNVLRSPDGVSPPTLVLYGTSSPGYFIFDNLTPTLTPTLTGQPTPTPTPTPPPPSEWPVAIGNVPADRIVQGVAIDDVVQSDPNLDVVAVAQTGKFKVYNHLGVPWPQFDINLNVTVDTAPVTADIDGDGEIEIILGTNEVVSDRNIIYSAANAILSIDSEFKQKYADLTALNLPPDANILRSVGLLNSVHYVPQGQLVFNTPVVTNLDGGSDREIVYTTRPMDPNDSSYLQVITLSGDPDTPPTLKMSIKPRRLVRSGKVLITEINPVAKTTIATSVVRAELTNVSGGPVDLKNWSVIFYDTTTWPEPTDVVPIEGDANIRSVANANEVIRVSDGPSATLDTTIPTLGIRRSLMWEPTSTRIAVALRDNRGRIVDFVTTGTASQIKNPVAITVQDWAGSGLLLPPTAGSTFQRFADATNQFRDNNNRGDWVGNAGSSLGSLNPNFTLPFLQGIGILGEPAVGDVDGDSVPEIVVGSNLGDLYVFEFNPGGPVDAIVAPIFELTDPTVERPSFFRPPALVDVDNDPNHDQEILIAVSERDGNLPGKTQLHCVHGNGQAVFGQSLIFTPTQTTSSLSTPVVGLSGSAPNSEKVVLFATRRSLVALNLSQRAQKIFDFDFPTSADAFASSAPAIGQAEIQSSGPEAFEFFIGGGGGSRGNLFGFYYDAAADALVQVTGIADHREPTLPGAGTFAPILGGIELADLNGDLQTEVVYTNEIGYINVFSPRVPASGSYLEPSDFPWPAYKHDRARTGSLSELTAPHPVSPYRAGDINRDGVINELDLFSIAQKWSREDMFKRETSVSDAEAKADYSNGAPHVRLLGVISDLKR